MRFARLAVDAEDVGELRGRKVWGFKFGDVVDTCALKGENLVGYELCVGICIKLHDFVFVLEMIGYGDGEILAVIRERFNAG